MYLKILAHPVFTNLNFHMPMIVDLSHPLVMLHRRERLRKIHATALHHVRPARREGGWLHLQARHRQRRARDAPTCSMPSITIRACSLNLFKDQPEMLEFLQMASHGQVMLSMFKETFPKLPDGTILLLDEPEMALSVSNQRRILKMLMELVDQKKFRIICATHSPVLIEAPETYVINLDRHINRNVVDTDQGIQGASTIQ